MNSNNLKSVVLRAKSEQKLVQTSRQSNAIKTTQPHTQVSIQGQAKLHSITEKKRIPNFYTDLKLASNSYTLKNYMDA